MDIHRLRYFLCIAEEGSMSRAATVLGIVQPALSRQMRLLEDSLGVTLFLRTPRGVQLTDDGEQLRAALTGPLHQIELAMRNVGSPLAHIERDVVFGMPESTAHLLGVPLIASLTTAFPKVTLRVVLHDSSLLVDAMLKGEVDLALIHAPAPDERLFYGDLVAEELVLVGGPTSGLAVDRPVEFRELAEFPLVLPSPQPGLKNLVENTALRLDVKVKMRFEIDSLALSKELIAAGLAYGILPVSAFYREVEAGRLRYAPLCEPVMTQRLGIAARPQLVLPRGFVMKFGSLVRQEVAGLVGTAAWPGQLLPSPDLDEKPVT